MKKSTYFEFWVFKHTHIPTKVDYESINFWQKEDEKDKQKENMLNQDLKL